jgi:hypothetical protein
LALSPIRDDTRGRAVPLFGGVRWTDAGKGHFPHVPQGGLRAFRNNSDAPAEMRCSPRRAHPREEYFEKV